LSSHQLLLNAVDITQPDVRITVGQLPYNKDVLDGLRQEQAGTLLAQRHEGVIEVIPLITDIPIVGVAKEVDLSSRPSLVAALARESLIRFLGGDKHYPILSRRPLRVIGAKPPNLVSTTYGLPEWLEKRIIIRFDTRVLYKGGTAPRVILLCDVGTRNSLTVPCSELHRVGVPLVGRYVTVLQPAFDPRLEDYRKIVGRVTSIENGVLRLEDHAEGYSSITVAFFASGASVVRRLGVRVARVTRR
jgi:hypothetical protein